MKIKVCGMRDGNNIRGVESLHPNMMGFIFWDKSKRNVTEIPYYMPNVCRVGVFVDPTLDDIIDKVKTYGLNRIQLHGSESHAFCRIAHERTGLPITKAISINDWLDLEKYHEYEWEPSVDMFLFDTKCKMKGGSGEQFDWDILHFYNGHKPFLLAGGIGPGDEDRLKSFHHPQFAGIDINSRFETAPAIKDIKLLEKFIKNIQS